MQRTKTFSLTAGSSNDLLTVPNGYKVVVNMLTISNVGASSAEVTISMDVDGVAIDYIKDKPIDPGDFLEFGSQFDETFVFRSGDTVTVTPEAGASMSGLVTFTLYSDLFASNS